MDTAKLQMITKELFGYAETWLFFGISENTLKAPLNLDPIGVSLDCSLFFDVSFVRLWNLFLCMSV